MRKTQIQIFYEESRKISEANETFLFLAEQGMTREDLEKNIARRPALWGRFANWLKVLPSKSAILLSVFLLASCASPQREPEYWQTPTNYGPYQIIPPSAYVIRAMVERETLRLYGETNQ